MVLASEGQLKVHGGYLGTRGGYWSTWGKLIVGFVGPGLHEISKEHSWVHAGDLHEFEKGQGAPARLEEWVHGHVALGLWAVKGAAGTARAGTAHRGLLSSDDVRCGSVRRDWSAGGTSRARLRSAPQALRSEL